MCCSTVAVKILLLKFGAAAAAPDKGNRCCSRIASLLNVFAPSHSRPSTASVYSARLDRVLLPVAMYFDLLVDFCHCVVVHPVWLFAALGGFLAD